MAKLRQGKGFEELVTWITRCLHEKAVITPNDKIRDIHSDELREIDISIRLNDGPANFLGIIEVRDRLRPVGVNYIEEVSTKCKSVGADAAFIISSSGFYDSAIKKALALNIRIFSYKEAVSSNWAQCLQLTEIVQFLNRWDNLTVAFIDPATNVILIPHQDLIDALAANTNAPIFVTENNEPKASIASILNRLVNKNLANFYPDPAGSPRRKIKSFIDIRLPPDKPQLFFRDATGMFRKLQCIFIEGEFWKEIHKSPVRLSHYSNAGTGEALAEVASATIENAGKSIKVELIAKFLGKDGKDGSQIMLRMKKADESP